MNRCLVPLAVLAAFAAPVAAAADIRVLAGADVKSVLAELIPGFERQTGHHLVFVPGSPEETAERARKDSSADVVIVPPAQMNALAKAGRILPDTRRTLGRLP